jgi:FKBP-type peptidyl-prolyl cis-trans isomerase 2
LVRLSRRLTSGNLWFPIPILAIALAVGVVLVIVSVLVVVPCGFAACGEESVATDGDELTVHYTGTLDDGTAFDSSRGGEALSFTMGEGRLVPGFEDAVRGLAVGDSVTVRLEPADAYGERSDEFIIEVPADAAPDGFNVGDRVQLATGRPAIIIAMTDEIITLDANHHLAGLALTFNIELVTLVSADN